jgi:4-cresol dehydrogenase (hydroxylating)
VAGSTAAPALAGDLTALLDDLRAAVGEEHVISGDLGLSQYTDPYSPLPPGQDPYWAAAAVCPGSVGEVADVMQIATRHRRPAWPISTGRNLAYGGPAPGAPGALMLDLRRMNRVLEVSEKFGYALVEPGCTYFDLYKVISEQYPDWWVDVPELGWGGPVGNTAERGNGYLASPYSDHFASHCGMEVVLPDGQVVRTGTGALPGSTTWQLHPYGYGPYLDGLFTGSNLGIITKLGVWLMPRPDCYRPFMITFPREEDIGPVTDIVRRLRLSGALQNAPAIRSLLLEAAGAGATRDQYAPGGGLVPPGLRQQIAAGHQIGEWTLYAAQYGSQAVIDALLAELRAAFGEIPGARWYFEGDRPAGSVLEHRARRMRGVPGLEDLRFLEWAGPGGGHLNVSPLCPAAGTEVLAQYRLARDLCQEAGLDLLSDIIGAGRSVTHIIMLTYDRDDAGQKRQCLDLAGRLVAGLAGCGWPVYRTHLALMADVAATVSWGDDALMRLVRMIKDAVDPGHILAPGRNGI